MMKYTIDLTPEEERRLLEAEGRGIQPSTFIKAMLAALPSLPYSPEKSRNPTAELFAEWESEAQLLTETERHEQDKFDEAFLSYLHAHRQPEAISPWI